MGWITVEPGIRCREHATRRHGVRPDRYYTVRLSVDGRQIEEGLGWASEGWTLDKARAERNRLHHARRTGEGAVTLRESRAAAQAARRAAAAAPTVNDLWRRYLDEVVCLNKPATQRQKIRLYQSAIGPAIGSLKVHEVTSGEIGEIVRAPLRRDAADQIIAGKAEAANLWRFISHLFGMAAKWGMRPRALPEVLDGIVMPKVQARERLLSDSEVAALLQALDDAEAQHRFAPQVAAAIRALILTGARANEILTLRRVDIRRDEMTLHLPDTKTGFSRRPISAATLAVFDSLERRPGVEFVFSAVSDPRRPLALSTVQQAFGILVDAAGIRRPCSLHTLRHRFATMTANASPNARVGMLLTGHKDTRTYLRYVHADAAAAAAMAEQLAAQMANLTTTPIARDDLVPDDFR
jgi:site-specific recombinase XerC